MVSRGRSRYVVSRNLSLHHRTFIEFAWRRRMDQNTSENFRRSFCDQFKHFQPSFQRYCQSAAPLHIDRLVGGTCARTNVRLGRVFVPQAQRVSRSARCHAVLRRGYTASPASLLPAQGSGRIPHHGYIASSALFRSCSSRDTPWK